MARLYTSISAFLLKALVSLVNRRFCHPDVEVLTFNERRGNVLAVRHADLHFQVAADALRWAIPLRFMQQLGERMGYPEDSARKSVSQFFKTHDPKVSALRRFAKALDIAPAELFVEAKKS